MDLVAFVSISVRGWALWLMVPGLSRRTVFVLGIVSALCVFDSSSLISASIGINESVRIHSFISAILRECAIGILVVIPFLIPVWSTELIGGIVDLSTNLSLASIISPMAPNGSKGIWAAIFRELNWGNMVLLGTLPRIVIAFAESITTLPPGSCMAQVALIERVTTAWYNAGVWIAQTIIPFLLGCLAIEIISGLVSRFSLCQEFTIGVQLMKCGLSFSLLYYLLSA